MEWLADHYSGEYFLLRNGQNGDDAKPYSEWDFDFRALIAEIGVQFGIVASKKGLYLALSIEPDAPRYLRGNPIIVKNMISGLIEYSLDVVTEGGMTIQVSSFPLGASDRHRLEINITDTGPGTPAGNLRSSRKKSNGSARLHTLRNRNMLQGPFVSEKIAGLMDGHISIHSIFGWGTRYSVNFTLRCAASPASHINETWRHITSSLNAGEPVVGAAFVDNIPQDLSDVDILKSLKKNTRVLSVIMLFHRETIGSPRSTWIMLQHPNDPETIDWLNNLAILGRHLNARLMGYWYPGPLGRIMESDAVEWRRLSC